MKCWVFLGLSLLNVYSLDMRRAIHVNSTKELFKAYAHMEANWEHEPHNPWYESHILVLNRGYYRLRGHRKTVKLHQRRASRFFNHALKPKIHLFENRREDHDPVFLGNFEPYQFLGEIERLLSPGHHVSTWAQFRCSNEREFLKALIRARRNGSHTFLHLTYCQQSDCIQNPKHLDFLKSFHMPTSDSMNLGVASQSLYQERPKSHFINSGLGPFVRFEP